MIVLTENQNTLLLILHKRLKILKKYFKILVTYANILLKKKNKNSQTYLRYSF